MPENYQKSIQKRRNQALVFIGAVALIVLVLAMGSSSLGGGSIAFGTPSATLNRDEETITPGPTPTQPILPTIAPSPTETQPPAYSGMIVCEDLGQMLDRRQCTVTSLGSTADTLWLAFDPISMAQDHHINLSIVLPDTPDPVLPNLRGLASLGIFEPGSTKTITLQMFCVDTASGCPSTRIHVQLRVREGDIPIAGTQGEFDITNGAYVEPALPTRRPPGDGPVATQPPPPIFSSTPSDALGPTPTP